MTKRNQSRFGRETTLFLGRTGCRDTTVSDVVPKKTKGSPLEKKMCCILGGPRSPKLVWIIFHVIASKKKNRLDGEIDFCLFSRAILDPPDLQNCPRSVHHKKLLAPPSKVAQRICFAARTLLGTLEQHQKITFWHLDSPGSTYQPFSDRRFLQNQRVVVRGETEPAPSHNGVCCYQDWF